MKDFFFIKHFHAHQTKNAILEAEMVEKLGDSPDYGHYLKKAQKYVGV